MKTMVSVLSAVESQAEELVAVETLALSSYVRANDGSNENGAENVTAPATAAASPSSSERTADAPVDEHDDAARRELAVAGLLELRTIIRVHNINGERTSGLSTSSDECNKTAFNGDSSHEASSNEASSNNKVSNEASANGNLSTASALAEDCDVVPGPSTSLNGNGNGIANSDNSDSTEEPSVLLRADGVQRRSIVGNGDQIQASSTLAHTPYKGLRNGHLTQTIEKLTARLAERRVFAVDLNYRIVPGVAAFGSTRGHSESDANEAQLSSGSFDYAENWLNQAASRAANSPRQVLEWTENKENSSPEWIPIGTGHTMIPASVYRHVNWESYTSATRTLLMEVFSRNVLATHSLTGRASNAFPSKAAKAQLDARKVNDIVVEVVRRCDVAENLVRTCITTKCADESKMYRTRQQNQHNKRRK